MARLLSIEGHEAIRIDNGWLLASTQANAIATPNELPSTLKWITAIVPGTVALARAAAGTWNAGTPATLHGEDHWYRTSFQGLGKRTLRFHGLATLATVWLNGVVILSSRSMFVSHDIAVDLKGDNELVVCFRSLDHKLSEPWAAGRWRPRMIAPSSLRHVRTTLLGHMPGWCPQIDVAGPWRAIECMDSEAAAITCDVHANLVGTTGLVEVLVDGVGWPGSARIECANRSTELKADSSGILRARLEIPGVETWWPHTHGTPALHRVDLFVSGRRISLGRVGFRSIEVDKGAGGRGFGLVVNGVPIFCRGAVWSSADVAGLPESRDALEPWLQRAKEAGMNMLRVPGTGNAHYIGLD